MRTETRFFAKSVYDCLKTVPVDKHYDGQLVTYFRDSLEFQSTLNLLSDPPAAYQQPRVGLRSGLNHILSTLDNDRYTNQYEFEAALFGLIRAAHDHYLRLDAGVLAAINFGSQYAVSSLSADGKEVPKLYLMGES
jgi:hypothetical protein